MALEKKICRAWSDWAAAAKLQGWPAIRETAGKRHCNVPFNHVTEVQIFEAKMNSLVFIQAVKLNLLRRPLMPPSIAQQCLDVFRPKINKMIESGELSWAFNVGASKSRKEIRILTHCVIERAMGPLPQIGATKNLELPEVVNLILPQKRETFRSSELQRLFHVSPDLIRDLSASGELVNIYPNRPATGPNSSPRFTRDSVMKLLENRRIV